MKKVMLLLTIGAAGVLFGCDSDHDGHAQETPEAEVCEHLAAATSQAVTAAADPTATGVPDVSPAHKRFDVTLVTSASQKLGWVKIVAPAAGNYALALDAAVPVHVQHADGTALTPKDPPKFPCTTVQQAHTLPLTVGTWHVRLGPTALSKVGLLVEEL